MNKKIIRLTESDLHRIIKESVEEILNEEIDPRSWAAVSDKYSKAGDSLNANYAHQRAQTAWNRKYGKGNQVMGPNNTVTTTVNNGDRTVGFNDFYGKGKNTATYRDNNGNFLSQQEYTGELTPGERVASQMRRGNGQYIKGKGWQ